MEIVEKLKQSREKTLLYYDVDEKDYVRTYEPGKWNIRQLLHHLADSETVLYDRIRRVISEPKQVIWAFDQDAWCKELNYMQLPLCLNKAIYTSVRESVIYLAENFYESHGDKVFIHSETGLKSLKEEFDKIAWHNNHHLAQIESALAK